MEMTREAKKAVYQSLRDMGFQDADIKIAIAEYGFDVERCANYLVQLKPPKQKLYVGMEVWIYSVDDRDWVPGNVVSVTKQLVSIIFNGHDFRWLEKDSEFFTTHSEKPDPMMMDDGHGHGRHGDDDEMSDDGQEEHVYAPPKADEVDYVVLFPESVLGLELYSDEDGYNCIVGRCVSQIARQNVTPGSQIIQVNGRWLAGYRFEDIRDAVKQAAKEPPLEVKFRIRQSLMRQAAQQSAHPNGPSGAEESSRHVKEVPSQQPKEAPASHLVAQSQESGYQSGYRSHLSSQPPVRDNPSYSGGGGGGASGGGGGGGGGAEKMVLNIANPRISGVDGQQIEFRGDPAGVQSFEEREEKSSRPEQSVFVPFMTLEQAELLRPGDHIDHRDDVGRFLLAVVVDKKDTMLKIHYEGWNSKWDVYSDYSTERHRFAAPRSISRARNTRMLDLKIRDYIDINPTQRHRGWRVGQIRRMDRYSGQVQVVYKEDGAEFLYWAHLNNPEETAPFMTKAEESLQKQHRKENQSSSHVYQRQQSSSRILPPSLQGKKLPPKPGRGGHAYRESESAQRWESAPVQASYKSVPSKKLPPLAKGRAPYSGYQ